MPPIYSNSPGPPALYGPSNLSDSNTELLRELKRSLHEMYRRFYYPLGSELVRKAARFSFEMHIEQRRKGPAQLPYFVHPLEVAVTLAWAGQDEYTVAAGFLHDVVEDCAVTYDELCRRFGGRTAHIVMQVTNVAKKGEGNRTQRQAIEREHLSRAGYEARNLKLVDVACNARSIVVDEPKFAETYLAEKRLLLPEIRIGSHPVLYGLACQAVGMAA